MDRYIHTCIHKQSHTLSYNVLHITDEWKRIGGEGGVGEGSDVVLCVILNCILKVKVQFTHPSINRSPGRAGLSHTGHTHLALLQEYQL